MVIKTYDSTSITFDLDGNTLSKLEKKSEHDGISIDTLVNEILIRHSKLDVSEPRSQLQISVVSIDKPAVKKIFEKMSREEAIKLAAYVGKDATTEAIMLMKNKRDMDSFFPSLELYMSYSSLEVTHNIKGNNHTLNIKHDLGENWSLYQKTIVESIFNEILRMPVDTIMVSKTILVFKFEGI